MAGGVAPAAEGSGTNAGAEPLGMIVVAVVGNVGVG